MSYMINEDYHPNLMPLKAIAPFTVCKAFFETSKGLVDCETGRKLNKKGKLRRFFLTLTEIDNRFYIKSKVTSYLSIKTGFKKVLKHPIVLLKCIIPAGAKYYIVGDSSIIVSTKLIVTETVIRRYE